MPPPVHAEIAALLDYPRESLEVEIKGWLDLSTTDHKATLAKGIIALANSGGGFIVIGLTETAGAFEEAPGRPADLAGYRDDIINGIVRTYAAPPFQCTTHRVTRAAGGEFPVIQVPGGHRSPVQALRGAQDPGTLSNGRVYIRRPGPQSAEPATPEEWRDLFARCIRANRDELLDAVRAVMEGASTEAAAPPIPATEALSAWAEPIERKWRDRLAAAPPAAAARPAGMMRLAYEVHGIDPPSLPELKRRIDAAQLPFTGWPEWIVIDRDPIRPYPIADGLEADLLEFENGEPAGDKTDLWRAEPGGRFCLIREMQEDHVRRFPPGAVFDLTLPIWRVGECLLHARRMAELASAPDAEIAVAVRFSGLAGRQLVSIDGQRMMNGGRVSRQDAFDGSATVNAGRIEDALPDLVAGLLRPLYALFSLFEPSSGLFAEELRRMREGRYR